MKTKINMLIVVVMVSISHSLLAENIGVTVVDDEGKPIEGATVDVWYTGFEGDGSEDKKSSGLSDKEGKYTGSGNARYRIAVNISKNGWYPSEINSLRKGIDHSVTIVLRKVINPISLYVREMKLEFPVFDKWLGFDFEMGDWVRPNGKGKSQDILFKFHRIYAGNKYSGKKLEQALEMSKRFAEKKNEIWSKTDFKNKTAKWKSEFGVAFLSELEGIVEEKKGYLADCEMNMPHLAPEEGYHSEEIKIKKKSFSSKEEQNEELQNYIKFGHAKPSAYFIRSRVVEVNGKVIKANYTKLAGRIEIEARGRIKFTYYFNPRVNERNLEYRPKSNLATEQRRDFKP